MAQNDVAIWNYVIFAFLNQGKAAARRNRISVVICNCCIVYFYFWNVLGVLQKGSFPL